MIQGDSLRILCGLAESLARRVRDKEPQDDEFLRDLQELTHSLVGRLLHYKSVLQEHGIELPYVQPVTESDLIRLVPEERENE